MLAFRQHPHLLGKQANQCRLCRDIIPDNTCQVSKYMESLWAYGAASPHKPIDTKPSETASTGGASELPHSDSTCCMFLRPSSNAAQRWISLGSTMKSNISWGREKFVRNILFCDRCSSQPGKYAWYKGGKSFFIEFSHQAPVGVGPERNVPPSP